MQGPGRWFAVLAMVLLLPAVAAAQTCPRFEESAAGLAAPLSYVRYLADDALEGRLAGSAGERCAGDFIAARFASLGLTPAGENGGWFQSLPLASVANPHAAGGTGRNVMALLEGADPVLKSEVVIIGAHYDHLGLGAFSSTDPEGRGKVHNGADDNASGVAAMLHAAETLARGERPARSVLFLAFTGEESGLLGSAYFTKNPTVPIAAARAMINLDMVGRLEGRPLVVYGIDTAKEWKPVLTELGEGHGVAMSFVGDGYGPSDHTSFYLVDIPVLHFFTNTHGQYHHPADDWDRIDAAGLEKVAALTAELARGIATQKVQVTLVKGSGPRPVAQSRGSGAWLGTVPDFSPIDRGVLLGGVSAGSPAEKAGLRKGDVLVRLGDHDVPDLQGMTDALGKHQPGDAVRVVVLRAGKEHVVEVVLGRRGG